MFKFQKTLETTPSNVQPAPSLRNTYNPTASFVRAEMEKYEARRQARQLQLKTIDFRLKQKEARVIVILDAALAPDPDNGITTGGFFVHLHKGLKIQGEWAQRLCLQGMTVDGPPCPWCKNGSHPSPVVTLTVYDYQQWTDKNGNIRKGSRKVFKLPYRHFERFNKFQQTAALRKRERAASESNQAIKQELLQSAELTPLRGLILCMEREATEKSESVGSPTMLPGTATILEVYTESEMIEEFGNPRIISPNDGKVLKEENEDTQPFNYVGEPGKPGIYTYPDVAVQYAEAGLTYTPPIGSRKEAAAAAAAAEAQPHVEEEESEIEVPSFLKRVKKEAPAEGAKLPEDNPFS